MYVAHYLAHGYMINKDPQKESLLPKWSHSWVYL